MIQRIVLSLDHNAERPADVAGWLKLVASHLDMMVQEHEAVPFLVRDPVVDSGTVTLYVEWLTDDYVWTHATQVSTH